ncbi:hypothetical protein YC2023_099974 [Brassica napus]
MIMRSVTSALREIRPKGVVRSLDIDLSNRSLAQDLKKKHGICCHVIMTSLEFLILSCVSEWGQHFLIKQGPYKYEARAKIRTPNTVNQRAGSSSSIIYSLAAFDQVVTCNDCKLS